MARGMKMKATRKKLILAILAGASLMLAAPSATARGKVLIPGISDLTADWYQWQEAYYPSFDFGEDCSLGQGGVVWFLGGTGGGDPVVRECYEPVPAGKQMLFPLVNVNWANTPEENLSVYEKRMVLDDVLGDQDAEDVFGGAQACKLTAMLDGEPVIFSGTPIQRVQTPPFDWGGDPKTVGDGYWVLLPKLPLGEHTIQFTGGLCVSAGSEYWIDVEGLQAGDELFKVDVTYILNIVE